MAFIIGVQAGYEEGDILHRLDGRWIPRGHMAEGALAPGNANAFAFNWQNPHANPIIVTRLVIDITTAGGTAAGTIDAGMANGTGVHGDDLIDGADPNVVTVYDNFGDPGANGKFKTRLDANGGANDWVTCQILLQNQGALAGRYYIEYIEVL